MFLFLCLWAWQLYDTDSLCLPGHPMTVADLREMRKVTPRNKGTSAPPPMRTYIHTQSHACACVQHQKFYALYRFWHIIERTSLFCVTAQVCIKCCLATPVSCKLIFTVHPYLLPDEMCGCVCLTSKKAGCYQISLLFKTVESDDRTTFHFLQHHLKCYVRASQSTGHNMYVQNRQKMYQYIKGVSERIYHTWTECSQG